MEPTDIIGFLDESRRPIRLADKDGNIKARRQSLYAVAAALVQQDQAQPLREGIQRIAASIPTPLHYADLTNRRRLAVLEHLMALPGWEAVIVETDTPVRIRNDRTVRGAVLSAVFRQLHDRHQITRLMIETRTDPLDPTARLDHDDVLLADILYRRGELQMAPAITHGTKSEPLLALPDLLVGARTACICAVDDAFWSIVAARAHVIQVSPQWADPRNAEAPGH